MSGRQNWRRGTRKAVCYQGHAFTPENTGRDHAGARECKTCRRAKNRRYYIRMRAGLTIPRRFTDAHVLAVRSAENSLDQMGVPL